jgi:hypothetical protein
MPKTYNPNLQRPIDKVRLLATDNVAGSMAFDDAEVEFFLSEEGGNIYYAAASMVDSLIQRFRSALLIDGKVSKKKVGDLEISYSGSGGEASVIKSFGDLAARLRARGGVGPNQIMPYAGGISKADNEAIDSNPDRPKRDFKRRMDDNPLAYPPSDQWPW